MLSNSRRVPRSSGRASRTTVGPSFSLVERLEDRRLLAADPRTVIDLAPSWKFHKGDVSGAQATSFNDSSWSGVSLPHTWNAQDGQDGGGNYYRGIGWYRKHVTVASSLAGKELFIKFDGASTVTDLYVNGTSIGEHRGAFAAFTFDVTPYLKVGQDNVIAVKVNNANEHDVAPLTGDDVALGGADFTIFGGLYRDVSLIATSKSHVTLTDFGSPGVFLTPTSVSTSSAKLQIDAEVKNDTGSTKSLSVIADVYDAKGKLVKEVTSSGHSISAGATFTFTQNTTISSPHLWNGTADPYLYSVVVRVQDGSTTADTVTQPLGFRFYTIDPSKGFLLNGKYLDLHGADYHQDRYNEGWAVTDSQKEDDISLMEEMGVNFVRLTHYQAAESVYDTFDQDGIMAWSEIPYIYDATNSSAFSNNLKDQLREMIKQNYNHPSIAVWGMFNGVEWDSTNASTLIPQLNDLAHQLDPTRPTTGATVTRAGADSPVNFVTDVLGYNDYFGWYRGEFDDLGPYVDDFHDNHPDTPLGIDEFGAGASINQHADNPTNITATDGKFHPEEYQNEFYEAQWEQMKSRKFLWEKTAFSMFDFASDDRNEGDTPGRNDKGLVTYDRKTKKDAFYFFKSNWTSTPTIYITSRRYTSRPSKTIPTVKIYSNLESVTLKVNGVTIGTSAGNDIDVFTWNNVKLNGGANTILVTGTKGGTTYTDSVVWTAPGSATNAAPIVNAGPNLSVARPNAATLDATVTDDGLPSTTLTTAWTKFSGPGTVTFGKTSSVDTTATFSADGTYVLRLTASDGSLASTDDVTVTVGPQAAGQAVTSLTLFNADTDKVVPGFDSIPNNATIDFAAIGTNHLSIRANTSPALVGSVRFALDANSNFITESKAPYAIAGDDGAGDYTAWTPSLGAHILTATPFTSSSGTGTLGTALTISFTVVNNANPTGSSQVVAAAADTYIQGGSNATTNFNGASDLEVKQTTTADSVRNALLKFDLTSIGTIAAGQSVILRLFGAISDTRNSNITTEVYGVGASWSESTVTYNTKPTIGAKIASQTITDDVARWYTWDITAYARSELAAGRKTIAVMLKNVQNTSAVVDFNRREGSSNTPQVVVSG